MRLLPIPRMNFWLYGMQWIFWSWELVHVFIFWCKVLVFSKLHWQLLALFTFFFFLFLEGLALFTWYVNYSLFYWVNFTSFFSWSALAPNLEPLFLGLKLAFFLGSLHFQILKELGLALFCVKNSKKVLN